MVETEEFAEALLDQISVELNEEKEISELSAKISDDPKFPKNFTNMEEFCEQNFSKMASSVPHKTSWCTLIRFLLIFFIFSVVSFERELFSLTHSS